MLLVSQAANGSLSARRLPSKPPASHRNANPYPLFANPRLARRRLALSGADAPRPRASAQPRAAAGEGPSGSAAAEDPVLVGVSDDRVPLEGVIQVERPGKADAQSKLVSYA
jgi:hypothetical protein